MTLTWVRDHYDSNKDRYIDDNEKDVAQDDWIADTITTAELQEVIAAGNSHTLLPAYDTPTPSPTFEIGDIVCYTPEQITCTIIAFYGVDYKLQRHDTWGMFLSSSIVPGECGASPTPPPTPPNMETRPTPPNMETRTMALTEGKHTIQISLPGYNTLNATINVSSMGVTCVSVTGGACGGSSPPSVSTSVWTVTTYLEIAVVSNTFTSWVSSKGGASGLRRNLAAIGEIIDGYLSDPGDIGYPGFAVTLANVGSTIDYYLG